ncbi:MAG TPA: hypothetical protein VJ302_25515 [Blastocatellia bacterium]|nr:hypothetical protein [Blastocatellia bacterium]
MSDAASGATVTGIVETIDEMIGTGVIAMSATTETDITTGGAGSTRIGATDMDLDIMTGGAFSTAIEATSHLSGLMKNAYRPGGR